MPDVLASSDRHRVVHHRNDGPPSERLIVTFAPKTDRLADAGFGTAFALSRGYDTVYVGQHRSAYHQGIDRDELAELILPIAAGREIVAYGNSVGAYAAMYFGGQLGARILAIAPLNSLHPLTTLDPEQSQRDFVHQPKLTEVPRTPHAPLVLFDPYQPRDSRMVKEWISPAYPDADLRPLTRTGHNVIMTLQQHKLLVPLVERFFRGEPTQEISLCAPGSADWYYAEGYRLQQQGDTALALTQFQTAFAAKPTRDALRAIIACAEHLGQKQVANAARGRLVEMKKEIRTRRAA